jgi:hypothetical protein
MKIRQVLAVSAAVVVMAGCADYGMGYYGGPVADVEYDGYYDNAYGPLYDGYWNNDTFYYRTSENDHWRRGDSKHFRRDSAPGFSHIHGTAHASAHGGGDHHPG